MQMVYTVNLLPCSACSTHTMDVLFDVSWEVIVKNMRDVMDIQPSGCQICGDQYANPT